MKGSEYIFFKILNGRAAVLSKILPLEKMSFRPVPTRADVRREGYKKVVGPEEARRRREETMVEIRKNRREQNLHKKRREGNSAFPPASTGGQKFSVEKKLDTLPQLVHAIMSQDISMQLECTTQCRRLLSTERNPPIGKIVEAGLVPWFVMFLKRSDLPQLQFEAAWALTNIASGASEHTKVVIDHGAVALFVHLLNSPNEDLREPVVWALGNVAGDSPKHRDIVLSHGAMLPLLAQFDGNAKLSMLRNAAWTLSNFCRGKPPPPFEQVKAALPTFERLLNMNDVEILADACWGLSYISDATNDKIQVILESGVSGKLVQLLQHPSPHVVTPALRTVGNIVTGDDIQTQSVLNNDALRHIYSILVDNHSKNLKREASWTVSNITAGNQEQIQAIIKADIIAPIVSLLSTAEFDIKKEAAWAISNATSNGTCEQIKFIVSQGCIKPLCDLLTCPDPRILDVCLDSLENILKAGEFEKNQGNPEGVNMYARLIEDADGLEKIEALQTHENTDIYKSAVDILENYFVDDEDQSQPMADTESNYPSGTPSFVGEGENDSGYHLL